MVWGLFLKSGNNAHISWEPPQTPCGDIKEYAVYLSVTKTTKPGIVEPAKSGAANSQYSFLQIYCGLEPSCVVQAEVLAKACIDTTSKPAILFRIAAKNEKGYGPATQVRWLQGRLPFEALSPREVLSLIHI